VVDFAAHNLFFLEFLMQLFGVLGMQISPFEGRRQEKYFNLKITSKL
jgi:hypothetical protein